MSPYFLRSKPDGSQRFILNLKKLNEYVKKAHFKLEDLRTATKLISKGDFMIPIDMKDAYFLVPIERNSPKYLMFKFRGKYYRFFCLPFGLTTGPLTFTKILKPLARKRRAKGILCVNYLDDWLVIGDNFIECLKHAEIIIQLL